MITLAKPTSLTATCDVCGLIIDDNDKYVRISIYERGKFVDSYKDLHRECCGVVRMSELLKEEL